MRFLTILSYMFLTLNLLGQQVNITSTNLPLILIDTQGNSIEDEPKTIAHMKIIYNGINGMNTPVDNPNIYNGRVGIELRGYYSQSLPQKPYGFETLDEVGDEINVPLLGFHEEHDWILLANYNDKAFVRNALPFDIYRKMGHYAPRTMHCEVVINNEYKGIYVFTEKIKRDKNRVNIPKMDADDNAGDSLTGGYIFKVDYSEGDSWTSKYSPNGFRKGSVQFNYMYPETDAITTQQRSYLKNHVDIFEAALFGSNYKDATTGYRAFIDVNSFIDYFIIEEITRNVDAYKKSCHYYKQSDLKGGLIFAGPVWDFDWSQKNFSECIYSNTDGSGWAYQIFECNPSPVPPAWMTRLVDDTYFANKLNDRYFSLRKTVLSEDYLFNYIDSVANVVDEAQVRHYKKWQILGENVGTYQVDKIPKTFDGEIQKLKDWFSVRLEWLDDNMIGQPLGIKELETTAINVYPNPVVDNISIVAQEMLKEVALLSTDGKTIQQYGTSAINSFTLNASTLSPGIYLLKITMKDNKVWFKKVVKN